MQNVRYGGWARALTTLFAVFLALPLLLSPREDANERSAFERRSLADAPAWPPAPAFFSQVDAWLDDHAGLALLANQSYRKLRFHVFHDDPVPNISVGKEGFVYLNSHDDAKRFSGLRTLCQSGTDPRFDRSRPWQRLFSELEQRGYRPALGIAVTKPVLYPEYLPDSVPVELRQHCSGYGQADPAPVRMAREFATADRVVYYPYAEFYRLREEPHFYPKENFHWEGLSARVFAQGLLAQLDILPEPGQWGRAELRPVRADLRVIGFERTVLRWDYEYPPGVAMREPGGPPRLQDFYPGAEDVHRFRSEPAQSGRRALLLSDSFGANVAQHLAVGFDSLLHININALPVERMPDFFGDYLDSLGVTDVIFLLHDQGVIAGSRVARIASALESRVE